MHYLACGFQVRKDEKEKTPLLSLPPSLICRQFFPAQLHTIKRQLTSQAKLSLIPARSPPGPQCQIKHLTAAPVPLSVQKDIWKLKLGN